MADSDQGTDDLIAIAPEPCLVYLAAPPAHVINCGVTLSNKHFQTVLVINAFPSNTVVALSLCVWRVRTHQIRISSMLTLYDLLL